MMNITKRAVSQIIKADLPKDISKVATQPKYYQELVSHALLTFFTLCVDCRLTLPRTSSPTSIRTHCFSPLRQLSRNPKLKTLASSSITAISSKSWTLSRSLKLAWLTGSRRRGVSSSFSSDSSTKCTRCVTGLWMSTSSSH